MNAETSILANDILTILGFASGNRLPITDLMEQLRHPNPFIPSGHDGYATRAWRLPAPGFFVSELERMGFTVIHTERKYGGGYLTLVTL